VEASWECRDCIVLDDEYFDIRAERFKREREELEKEAQKYDKCYCSEDVPFCEYCKEFERLKRKDNNNSPTTSEGRKVM